MKKLFLCVAIITTLAITAQTAIEPDTPMFTVEIDGHPDPEFETVEFESKDGRKLTIVSRCTQRTDSGWTSVGIDNEGFYYNVKAETRFVKDIETGELKAKTFITATLTEHQFPWSPC